MGTLSPGIRTLAALIALGLSVAIGGCRQCLTCADQPDVPIIPRELEKTTLPPYRIEPPDILTVDVLRVVPKPPYHIEALDALMIRVAGTPMEAPIDGVFLVSPDGTVNLGFDYGTIHVDGLTVEEAEAAISARLKKVGVVNPRAVVSLAQAQGVEQIRGEHLVRPDGTISLGVYGSVPVTGLTIDEARHAIEAKLAESLVRPRVSVDVLAYNSKLIYVVTDGAGYGQQVVRLPSTGNETVLDAISQINGLAYQASKSHIWVARPSQPRCKCDQVLPVDWNAIVERADVATNYQLLPGDRVYVKADAMLTLDNWIAKIVNPANRVFSSVLLGTETVNTVRTGQLSTGGGVP